MRPWPFAHLRTFGYRLILVDPPWSYEMYSDAGYEKSPEAHYETMSDKDILRLPVGDLAHGDGAVLLLWAVWPKLPLAQECIRQWGFKHITGGSWIKTTKDGTKLRIGPGYTFRTACEPFLVARIGNPQARLTDVANVIIAPGREHSRKPDEMHTMAERMSPHGPRCELFARSPWISSDGVVNDVWGNETGKFSTG